MAEARSRSRSLFACVPAATALLLSFAACRRAAPGPVRVMDALAEADVVRSPFLDAAPSSPAGALLAVLREGGDPAFPGSGNRGRAEALFRKLSRNDSSFDAVLAPPPTEISRRVTLPGPARLEFGCGVFPAVGRARGRVLFTVAAESGGRETPVFEKTIAFPPYHDVPPHLPVERVDLARFGSGRIRLVFRTATDSPEGFLPPRAVTPYWHDPIVVRAAAPPKRRVPNVILVSLDTLRSDHLGCYGYPRPVSPRLDALAADGVRFAVSVSPSNWTLPSTMSLLTGVPPSRHGVFYQNLLPKRPLISDRLRERGYVTGAFACGGYVSASLGFDRGFDFYHEDPKSTGNVNAPRQLAARARRWLERSTDRPFFLFLHTYHPHSPYMSRPEFGTRFTAPEAPWTKLNITQVLGKNGYFKPLAEPERVNAVDLYDGDIASTDADLVGPLVDDLKRLGLYDDTLIVVTSDHGESFYEHGIWLHGLSFYEEVARVPLIVKLPGGAFRGRVVEEPVPNLDLVPTVLDALGLPFESGPFDGRSLLPLVDGRGRERRAIFSERYHQVRVPPPFPNADRCLYQAAVLDSPWKLVFWFHRPSDWKVWSPPPPAAPMIQVELYNLKTDPGEKVNLVDREPAVVRRLIDRFKEFYATGPAPALEARPERKRNDRELTEQLKALGYVDNLP